MNKDFQHHLFEFQKLPDNQKSFFDVMMSQLSRLFNLNPDKHYLKLLSSNLVEYADAVSVFQTYRQIPKVCIFGSARTKHNHPLYLLAESLSKRLSELGYMVITGAGPGIMEAGNKGAGSKSFGLNILLPFEQDANKYIKNSEKLVSFKYFFLRKLVFVKESMATILFPGGFGTFDEAFEVLTLLQTGRTSPQPLILLDEPNSQYWSSWINLIKDQLLGNSYICKEDLFLFKHCTTIQECEKHISSFYSVYSSIKYFEDCSMIYTKSKLPSSLLSTLNKDFNHLLTSGEFSYVEDFVHEYPTDDHMAKFALKFNFDCKQFSGLVRLIDRINLV